MSRFPLTWFVNATLATMLFGMTGCGEPGIGSVPVTGTVKVDGKPMSGVTVVFNPAGSGRAASGLTDAEGKYKLTTIVSGDGALPGSYKIAVSRHENPADDLPKNVDPNDAKSLDAIYSKVDTRKVVKSKNLIAAQFENALGSGLVAEVNASGENNFNFDVKGSK